MTLLTIDPARFAAHYNRHPFVVRHALDRHPLAQLDALRALALRLPPGSVMFRFRNEVHHDFDAATTAHPTMSTLAEVFDRLHEPGTSIQINRPEQDPEYAPLVEEILGEIRRHTDAVDPKMTYVAAYFFVAGPRAVTPYHMDREMNFLLHVRGAKHLRLWDPEDRSIMSEHEREALFSSRVRPGYRPEFDAKAMHFDLQPGMGVHHPFIAPHSLRTGDDVSVSMAVTYRTRGSDAVALLYQLNHALRRVGLRPRPVGQSPGIDRAKAAAADVARRTLWQLRRQVRRSRAGA